MKKKYVPCPVEATLQLLENRWRVLIIYDLINGKKRFGELMKNITGISQRSLTSNLRTMETKGLIVRKVYAQVPPKVEYNLSSLGKSLIPILKQMEVWGGEYKKSKFFDKTADCK